LVSVPEEFQQIVSETNHLPFAANIRQAARGDPPEKFKAGAHLIYAVPGNQASLYRFRMRVGRYWMHVLARRSQRGRLSAERVARLHERWLPPPRVMHLYPGIRFDALHPR
jgi:hypothetical protein